MLLFIGAKNIVRHGVFVIEGFVISGFSSLHLIITGAKNIVRYTGVFVQITGFFSIQFTIIGLKNIVRYTGVLCYVGVLFHTFYYHYWGKEYRSLYRGLRYRGICYIGLSL